MRFQLTKLPITFGSDQVVQLKTVGRYTREEIQNIANERSRELYRKGLRGKMQVALKYDESLFGYSWRSGGFTPIGEDPILHTPSEYDSDDYEVQDQSYFNEFRIYFVKSNSSGGCDGTFNDCLFYCLQKAITPELFYFKNPTLLKKYFRLKRTDKIDISNLPSLEKLLKHKINVTGDFIYSSTAKYHKVINLTLINGHYELLNHERRQKRTATREKKIVFYKRLDKDLVLTYDGEDFIETSTEEIRKIRKKPLSSPFILVPYESYEDKMKTEYKSYIDMATTWKRITDGKINFWKTGTYNKTAVDYFYKITNTIETEPILQDEAIWTEEASIGALIFSEKYEGPLHCYDFCSFYPSLLKQNTRYPTKRGEFKTITQDEFNKMKFYPMGIYRCHITGVKINKLFRKNPKNKYTNIGLTNAKKLGGEINIIEDGNPNYLYYSTEKTTYGKQIFGEYIEYFFKFKREKVPGAKILLNILWGELCSTDVKPYYVTENQKKVSVDNRYIHSIQPISDETIKIETTYYNKIFNTDFARIKPFLLAQGRSLLIKVIQPNIDYVKRCHTDGFFTTKEITELPKTAPGCAFGNNLGQLKYEGYYKNSEIIHPNSYVLNK